MGRPRKSKKRSATNIRKLHRLILPFFYWRYHEDNDDNPLTTQKAYRGPIVPNTMDEIEFQVQNTPFFWQCVTITYCRDQWGKEYRLFGFGRTGQPLKVVDDPIEPLLTAALNYAEANCNSKHIYARGMVMAPWTKEYPNMISPICKVKKGLHLTKTDIDGITDYLETTPEYYEATMQGIDEEIAQYMKG